MSLAKSIAGFIISSLFVIFLYLTITSYTIGNSLQKENFKEFVQSQLNGDTASNSNESQKYIFDTIDDIYSKKLVSEFSLDDVLLILKNFLLFLIISIILGVSLFLVSEKPLSRIGNDLVVVAISSLAFVAIPMLIITPSESIVKIISDFLSQNLYKQLIIGIALLVIGIILVIIGKKKNK